MWDKPATQNNIETLKKRGIYIITPDSGDQACGETGEGRLKETNALITELLSDSMLLAGKKVLITAGPTREALDPVRYITNHSSGKMGYALAQQARLAGADVYVVSGPCSLPQTPGIKFYNVATALEMHRQVMSIANNMDIFIAAAAVADYRPAEYVDNKIKKASDNLEIKLVKNPDILSDVASMTDSPFCVGFAAETENLEANAQIKLTKKNLDMIIANNVGTSNTGLDIGFNSDRNAVTVITNATATNKQTITLPENTKNYLAKQLINLIAENYEKKHSS
ncbi:MAG: bifunctional phosphopantothenoylcysteine decarboxylase/phosphopantothenate--cysteine ligase CoaBC, partial [Gammaproteobacteria bacterium]|nr:bifunctional phosphopantothenoylcysteine decarboxylase/phosphopantothenate--cysteine ligase CoaBC [Gammaproteobacteria bacterium]